MWRSRQMPAPSEEDVIRISRYQLQSQKRKQLIHNDQFKTESLKHKNLLPG